MTVVQWKQNQSMIFKAFVFAILLIRGKMYESVYLYLFMYMAEALSEA
jgi:hypothetical protein